MIPITRFLPSSIREGQHIRLLFAMLCGSRNFSLTSRAFQSVKLDEDVPARLVTKAADSA